MPTGTRSRQCGMVSMALKRELIRFFEPLRVFLCFNVCSSKLFNLKPQSPTPDEHLVPAAPAASATFAALPLLFLSLSCFPPSYSSHPKTQTMVTTSHL